MITMWQGCFIRAYWKSRQETVSSCAARLSTLLGEAQKIHPYIDNWHAKGRSKQEALDNAIGFASKEVLTDLLLMGANRRELDHSVIDELGWSLSLWNGCDGRDSVSLDLRCGCYGDVVPNICTVAFNREIGQVFTIERAVALIHTMVRALDPESIVITSDELLDALECEGVSFGRHLPGWVMYFADYVDHPYVGIRSFQTQRVLDSGTAIVLSENAPSLQSEKGIKAFVDLLKRNGH